MRHYRLTKKFADDCKIKTLVPAPLQTAILDDWIIDVFTVQRKKVAIVTHTKTLFTLLIPYCFVGGAQSVIKMFPRLLHLYLHQHHYGHIIQAESEPSSRDPVSFCKTENKRVLGHMKDFKWCIEGQIEGLTFDRIDWDCVTRYVNTIPVNIAHIGFTTPLELLETLLKEQNHTIH